MVFKKIIHPWMNSDQLELQRWGSRLCTHARFGLYDASHIFNQFTICLNVIPLPARHEIGVTCPEGSFRSLHLV